MTDTAVQDTVTTDSETAPMQDPPNGDDGRKQPRIGLPRILWGLTTLGFLLAAVILLLGRRYGYSEVTFAVALAAAINLL